MPVNEVAVLNESLCGEILTHLKGVMHACALARKFGLLIKLFNLEKLLHRGSYVVESDHQATGGVAVERQGWSWRSALGITDEFSRGDKIIYGITIVKSLGFFVLWIVMTVLALGGGIGISGWTTYHYYVNAMFFIVTSFIVMIWLEIDR